MARPARRVHHGILQEYRRPLSVYLQEHNPGVQLPASRAVWVVRAIIVAGLLYAALEFAANWVVVPH